MFRSNPHQRVPSTIVTASPRDPGWGRVQIHDTLRYGRGVGFMGGMGCGDMDWIELAHDADRLQALVNEVMNPWVP